MKTFTIQDRIDIREAYKAFRPRIGPYEIFHPWMDLLTPIEMNIWSEIRCYGLPFYPQFPVLNYFIDFADPLEKIGIEVDGKEFHQDKEKDRKRQLELEAQGWRIFRISGRHSFYDVGQWLDDEGKKLREDNENVEGLEHYRYDMHRLINYYDEKKEMRRLLDIRNGVKEPSTEELFEELRIEYGN